jgi:methionine biosynthesis protein MetW
VASAVSHGLSVVQGDADTDLTYYPDNSFDYVILSQTLQATRDPRRVLTNMLRIGKHAIVSFPNFGHWRIRLDISLHGRMPVTDTLSYQWYETPNIHFCTIRDFLDLCKDMGIGVQRSVALGQKGNVLPNVWSNLVAAQGLFLLSRGA